MIFVPVWMARKYSVTVLVERITCVSLAKGHMDGITKVCPYDDCLRRKKAKMTTALTRPASGSVCAVRAERTVSPIPTLSSSIISQPRESFTDLLVPEAPEFTPRSNTHGQGRAIVPSRARVRRSERLVENTSAAFDNDSLSFIERWTQNVEKFVTSPGGMSLSVGTMVLTMGLSPLFL